MIGYFGNDRASGGSQSLLHNISVLEGGIRLGCCISIAEKARVFREADTPGWSSNNCFPILPHRHKKTRRHKADEKHNLGSGR